MDVVKLRGRCQNWVESGRGCEEFLMFGVSGQINVCAPRLLTKLGECCTEIAHEIPPAIGRVCICSEEVLIADLNPLKFVWLGVSQGSAKRS